MRNIKSIFRGSTLPILGSLLLLVGCDTTKTNNKRSDFPVPQIGVNNSIANVKIGEKWEARIVSPKFLKCFHSL
jgi:hypothetical protein